MTDEMSDGDFAMFSAEGNAAVKRMVMETFVRIRALLSEENVRVWVTEAADRIARHGHTEVYDTMVREVIAVELGEAWREAYGHPYPSFFPRPLAAS